MGAWVVVVYKKKDFAHLFFVEEVSPLRESATKGLKFDSATVIKSVVGYS